jgi:hypothetical protein
VLGHHHIAGNGAVVEDTDPLKRSLEASFAVGAESPPSRKKRGKDGATQSWEFYEKGWASPPTSGIPCGLPCFSNDHRGTGGKEASDVVVAQKLD